MNMGHKFYVSEDFSEWMLRTWELDYPNTIRFQDFGPDRDELYEKAVTFWGTHIEPMRAERERKAREREERKAAKGD